jgi:hypothetical protein
MGEDAAVIIGRPDKCGSTGRVRPLDCSRQRALRSLQNHRSKPGFAFADPDVYVWRPRASVGAATVAEPALQVTWPAGACPAEPVVCAKAPASWSGAGRRNRKPWKAGLAVGSNVGTPASISNFVAQSMH